MSVEAVYIYDDLSIEAILDLSTYHVSPSGAVFTVETTNLSSSAPISNETADKKGSPLKTLALSRDVPSQQYPKSSSVEIESHLVGKTKQLSSLVTSKHIDALKTIILLRNAYTQNTYLTARLTGDQLLERATLTNTAMECARWPLPSDLEALGDAIAEDGTVTIKSLDRTATLALSSHRRTFVVQYPAAVDDPDERAARIRAASRSTGDADDSYARFKYVYTSVQQRFVTSSPPECWKYPLWLAMTLAGGDVSHLLPLPKPPTPSTRHISIPLPASNQNISPSNISNSTFYPSHAHNHDPSNPKTIRCIWTPIALYVSDSTRFLKSQQDEDEEDGLYAIIHADGAFFQSSGGFRFLTLFTTERRGDARAGNEHDCEMYPVENSPQSVHNSITGRRYPFKTIVDELLRLYTNLHLSLSTQSAGSSRSPTPITASTSPTPYSSQLIVEITIPEAGKFTAYSDHRIIVNFNDRTILELDAGGQFAHILDTFGEKVDVRVLNPLSWAKYTRPAIQFRRWALSNDNERRAIKNERQEVVSKLKRALGRSQYYLIQQDPTLLRPAFSPPSPALEATDEMTRGIKNLTIDNILHSVQTRNSEFLGAVAPK
ncbi:hypothetical protein SmJEL517_g02126 [Synchytrium microbalum]|uniref:Uncharacterized protein n=1 Tax=Synchytrium microbalum TaxID=1806994 RepID=A0A507CBQ3_9FUNG|nr:uncharacterized protein SmJEL517_g02126 [Synchytrium microbalum]TPX35436.1 hypothetical protein SmJEL517_g02126 [Synchytrium microbalum]